MNTDGSGAPSQSSSSLVVDDNPCWGGPTPDCHNLDYLLRVLGSSASTITASHVVVPSSFSPDEHQRRVIDRVVVYQDANYIVLSKPPDLRMDGPHAATVHKLLLYLYSPPSLLHQRQVESTLDNNNNINSNNNNNNNSNSKADNNHKEYTTNARHRKLIASIASVSNRTCVPDDTMRWIHQLDYATSGVLLVGRTKRATAAAARSFEQRRANKVYSAVVISSSKNGNNDNNNNDNDVCHLPPLTKDFLKRLPKLPSSSLDSWCNGTLENQYKKKRQRETMNNGSTIKFATMSSVFDRWRRELMVDRRQQGAEDDSDQATTRRKKKKKNQRLSSLLPELPTPNIALTPDDITRLLSYGKSWKLVKRTLNTNNNNYSNHNAEDDKNERINWIKVVGTMTKEYNVLLKEYYDQLKKDSSLLSSINTTTNEVNGGEEHDLPPLFRIEDDDQDTFYMCASIGEITGRFRVLVDPTVSLSQVDEDISSSSNSNSNNNDISLPQMRPALTKCQVVWRGDYHYNIDDQDGQQQQPQSIPVAKVVLYPRTGRRHQLRVHLAYIAGCPILGDASYGGNLTTANNHEVKGINDGNAAVQSPLRGYVCRRMCLHARELTIPLIGNEIRTFVAPDPFLVMTNDDNNGEETIVIE